MPEGRKAYAWSEFWSDLVAVAEALTKGGRERVALGLGHSFGGTSMVLAAAHRPGLFERLVLLDPVLMPPPGFEPPAGVQRLVIAADRDVAGLTAAWKLRDRLKLPMELRVSAGADFAEDLS